MTTLARWRAGLAVLVALVTAPSARADSPASPYTYRVTSANGKYAFVMLSPNSVDDECREWNEATAAEIRRLRCEYAVSGLYPANESARALWTVDWYRHGVEVASDGVHLLRGGPCPYLPRDRDGPGSEELATEAVSFFANGRLIRTYSIGELVDRPDELPRSVTHFNWLREASLDDERSEYTVVTLDGNRFVFDLRTGDIVSQSRVGRRMWWGWWIVGAVGIVALGAALGLGLARCNRPAPNPVAPPRVER